MRRASKDQDEWHTTARDKKSRWKIQSQDLTSDNVQASRFRRAKERRLQRRSQKRQPSDGHVNKVKKLVSGALGLVASSEFTLLACFESSTTHTGTVTMLANYAIDA
jgi:hypothetical protein